MAQLGHGLGLDLADALPGDPVDLADLIEGLGLAIGQTETHGDHAGLTLREGVQHGVELLLQEGEAHRVGRDHGLGVLNEVTELGVPVLAQGRVQGDRLAPVLLDLDHLLRGHVQLDGQLLRGGLTSQVLEHLALHAGELVDDLDHVHRDADGAGLVRHRAGDGLADPPGGVGGELEALGVVELLHGADEAQVALLDEVQEEHAAARVALGQGDHQSQVGLQQVVLGPLAVLGHPVQLATQLGRQVVALLGQAVLGVKTGLDALGELDLLLGVQQRDLTDLLEVVLDRVRGGTGGDDPLGGLVALVGVGDGEGAVLVLGLAALAGLLGGGLLRLLPAHALELTGQGRDGGLHLDALDDPSAEDVAVLSEVVARHHGGGVADDEAGHRSVAVGGQRDGLLQGAVAGDLQVLHDRARAHEESRPRGQADPLERGGVVEGAALGAVAVLLQAHVQVVVAQLRGRAVILLDGLRLGVVALVLLLVRGVLVVRVVVVLVVIVGVVVSFVVEVEVLVVERGLVDVVSELGAGARHCGRSHGVPFA